MATKGLEKAWEHRPSTGKDPWCLIHAIQACEQNRTLPFWRFRAIFDRQRGEVGHAISAFLVRLDDNGDQKAFASWRASDEFYLSWIFEFVTQIGWLLDDQADVGLRPALALTFSITGEAGYPHRVR